MRFEDPIAKHNQYVFASDWMTYVDENLDDLLRTPMPAAQAGVPAVVIATGPTARYSAMPEVFESLMHAARRELVILRLKFDRKNRYWRHRHRSFDAKTLNTRTAVTLPTVAGSILTKNVF